MTSLFKNFIYFTRNKNFLAYLSFSIATSLLGFVATLAMTRLISPVEFGRIALFLSINFLVAPLISFSADNLIAIKKAKLGVTEYENFRRSLVTFAYISYSIIQLSVFILFVAGVIRDVLFLLIPLSALIKYLIGLASIEYVMEEKSVQYGLVSSSTTLLSLLLTIIFMKVISADANWRITALMISDVLFLLVRYRSRLYLIFAFSLDKIDFREIVRFGFPLLLSVPPAWAMNELDKVIVAKYTDMASMGLYAAATAIGGFLATFNVALLNAMLPKLYRDLGLNAEETMSIVKDYLYKFMLVSVFFAVGFALVYWLTADFILPEKYALARPIVLLVIVFSLCRSVYAILGAATDYFGMTKEKLKGIILGGIAAVISMMAGITFFGIEGATLGVGVGYSVLSLTLWLCLSRRCGSISALSDK